MNRDFIVRELMNGTWFLLGVFLIVAMAYRLRERTKKPDWYNDPGVQALIALLVYFVGSITRSAWIWAALTCTNIYGRQSCEWITARYQPLIVASVLAVVGATCCIRIFSPPSWRPWSWIGAGVLAIAVPVFVHWII